MKRKAEETAVNKKMTQLAVLTVLLASPVVSTIAVHAETIDTKIEEQDKKIDTLKSQTKLTQDDLVKIEDTVSKNEDKSKQILTDIQNTQNDVDRLAKENMKLTKKIEQRNDQLKEQARSVQVNGASENYIEFVISAESLSDVIGRIDVVSQVVSANRNMVKQQAEDKAKVAAQEKEESKKVNEQKTLAQELSETQSKLQQQKLEKETIVAQLAADTSTAEGDKQTFLAQKVAAEKQAEDFRIAKLAADKQAQENAAAQKAAAEEAAKANVKTPAVAAPANTTTNNNNQGSSSTPVGGGAYGMPVSSPVSSSYGPRSGYDQNGFHKGIDFASPVGTPVHASLDGVVVIAQQDGMPVSGYGIATVIKHDNGTWTLYAHQSSQSVRVGDRVTKGQVIGATGATGQVDGPHLHFEIRTAQNGGMGNVVNPAPLLEL